MTTVDLDEVIKQLESLRTFDDVVPVIRCRDCANCKETRDGSYLCAEWSDLTEPGAFCSYGKSVFDREEDI